MNHYTRFSLLILAILLTGLLGACHRIQETDALPRRSDYPDLIRYAFTPSNPGERAVPMADLGAWHGISLPDGSDKTLGVSGPYLLGEFRWTGPWLTAFSLSGDVHEDAGWDHYSAVSYPGLFCIEASRNQVDIRLETLFSSSRSYMNHIVLHNTGEKAVQLQPAWYGSVFSPAAFQQSERGFIITTELGQLMVSFSGFDAFDLSIESDTAYVAGLKEAMLLEPGEQRSFVSVVSYMPYGEDPSTEWPHVNQALEHPLRHLEDNQKRWNQYLKSVIRTDLPGLDYVPVKSLQTLITNWKTPTGDLRHQGLVPSMAVSYFYGFWAWDSWKHAVALAMFDLDLARDQVRTMFDYQDSLGMVADCVFPLPEENNWRDTKPPLAAWAVYEIYKASHDLAFVSEMLTPLEDYHQWWYNYRDIDRNGLCEWGSTDGTLIAAKWESGMDNAVRFDHAEMLEYKPWAHSMNLESVDLNAYLYLEKQLLAEMYTLIGNRAMAEKHQHEAQNLKMLIDQVFFNQQEGYYFDVELGTQRHLSAAGPEGWTPLWCGLSPEDKAEAVIQVMLDTARFNTFVPLPTLDASHPEFAYNGYWRGSIWLDQVYFGIAALRRYGYHQQADQLTMRVFENLEGLSGDKAIYENYDAHTGEALRAPNFSWSAAHLLMLYQELGM